MKNVETREVLEKKYELKHKIEQLLKGFEKDTGIAIVSVDLDHTHGYHAKLKLDNPFEKEIDRAL